MTVKSVYGNARDDNKLYQPVAIVIQCIFAVMTATAMTIYAAIFAMTDGVGWGSLRIDDEDGELISGLCQVIPVDCVSCNARDDNKLYQPIAS